MSSSVKLVYMENVPLKDRLILRFYPNFLYRGKYLQNVAELSVSLLHLASPKDHAWKFMDFVPIQKASIFKYRGTVKQLQMLGEMAPKNLIFEIIKAKSSRDVDPGDIVMIEPKSLSYFVDAPHA